MFMKRLCCLPLLLLIGSTAWAQMPQSAGPWGAPFLISTPAQSDWVDALQRATVAPYTAQPALEASSVSVARLRHKPPGRAIAALSRGLKFATAGKWNDGAREFQRAVAADPGFSEAHADLGVEYTFLGLLDQARDELQRSVELDPATGSYRSNLAYVLIRLGQKSEAERQLRSAIDLDAANTPAQFMLGYLLAQRPETRQAAIDHLVYAARQLPEAHYLLSRIYEEQEPPGRAAEEMHRYRKGIINRTEPRP